MMLPNQAMKPPAAVKIGVAGAAYRYRWTARVDRPLVHTWLSMLPAV